MIHMIRHECVGDTPWSRGNVYMRRSDIYGTSVLVTDGRHEASEGHKLVIRIREADVRVSATRATHAPRPQTETLPHGYNLDDTHRELRNDTSDPTPKETDEPEYVMDKIVGLRKADDGTWRYRVRW
jgi:hypothetical protein